MLDDIRPDRITPLLRSRWGRSLSVKETTESTMDDASAAAAQGAEDGHVVLADTQTRGRGAHGRHWVSPPGSDLYLSVVSRPRVEPEHTSLITLATGLGVRDAVRAFLPNAAVALKWPNDLWIGRRKCAGILVESRTLGARLDSVIIGVGLNVNRTSWPSELEDQATSLRTEGPGDADFDRAEVFATLLFHVERWVDRLARDGAAVIIDAIRPSLALVGERVRWEDGEGVFEGIEPDGAARVRTKAGTRSLHAAHLLPAEG